jgi:hypothetical protein
MRKQKVILLVAFLIILLAACKQKPETKIIGLWQLKEYKNNQEVAPELKDLYKQHIEEYVRTSSFEFKADSTLITKEKGEIAMGKWTVDKELKKITMYDDLLNSYAVVDIVLVDDKTMVLKSKNNDYIVQMTLVKTEKNK